MQRPARLQGPRRGSSDALALAGILVLGLMVLLWIAGGFGIGTSEAVVAASPTMTNVAAAPPSEPVATRTPEAKPQPTATSRPTPTPTPSPSPTPSPTPTPTPSPSPSRSPSPSPPPPTPPAYGVLILEPAAGAVVNVPGVRVSGLAPPGATVTFVHPLWFDDHTLAAPDGTWSFSVALSLGDNVTTFRLADDVSTAQTITVRYEP